MLTVIGIPGEERVRVRREGGRREGGSAYEEGGGAGKLRNELVHEVLEELGLDKLVQLEQGRDVSAAHELFENNSLDLVWNDAQWDPTFLQKWWPLVKKDGGLLLLHNVMGNGEISRWCAFSPRKVLRELFPGEKFEFVTLLEQVLICSSWLTTINGRNDPPPDRCCRREIC